MTPARGSLTVNGLTKTYSAPEADLHVLRGVNLSLQPGDAIAITGPSGSGKSTLLYILGLLDNPTSGSVLLGQEEPLKLPTASQARFRSQHIGFVFQDHHLLPQCSVLENVLIPTLAAGAGSADREARATELLRRVGLQERMHHRPGQLSGGEKQRAAVCRALINRPALLLADEPTGNLDRHSAQAVGTLLLEIAREQQAMLVCVTHSQELAGRFARHFELLDGQLVQQTAATV